MAGAEKVAYKSTSRVWRGTWKVKSMRSTWGIYEKTANGWNLAYRYPSFNAANADFQRRGLHAGLYCINTI